MWLFPHMTKVTCLHSHNFMKVKLVNKKRFIFSIITVIVIIVQIIVLLYTQVSKPNDTVTNAEVEDNIVAVQEQILIPTSIQIQEEKPIDNSDKNDNIILKQEIQKTQIENTYYDIPLSDELQDFIREKCNQYGVNMEIILGIMQTESNFQHDVSSKNQSEDGYSVGYMQLNTGKESYIKWYGELTGIDDFDPKNPYHNIEGGIAVYKNYQDYWENQGLEGEELLIHSLNSYNLGINGLIRYKNKTSQISRSYDRKVMANKNNLRIK